MNKINIVIPESEKGKPYSEKFEISGSLPISVKSHNLGDGWKVEMIGNFLCLSSSSPESDISVAVELCGSCTTCESVSVIGELVVNDDACECVPLTFGEIVLPEINIGDYVFFSVPVNGTEPIESFGGAAPPCLKITRSGNLITVQGEYTKEGDIAFSVSNKCMCDPITWSYNKGGAL